MGAGKVFKAKNQQNCGSCYAFAATAAVEAAVAIKANAAPVSLSEQQVVDCSGVAGNQGCNGGMMDNVFEYLVENNGQCSGASYPYTAVENPECRAASCTIAARITGYVDVPSYDRTALEAALRQQPVTVAISASLQSFQFYRSGVYNDAACMTSDLDHGVLLVGYGVDTAAGPFWKIKNSWGPFWGESCQGGAAAGCMRLARGPAYDGGGGMCQLQLVPSYPIAA